MPQQSFPLSEAPPASDSCRVFAGFRYHQYIVCMSGLHQGDWLSKSTWDNIHYFTSSYIRLGFFDCNFTATLKKFIKPLCFWSAYVLSPLYTMCMFLCTSTSEKIPSVLLLSHHWGASLQSACLFMSLFFRLHKQGPWSAGVTAVTPPPNDGVWRLTGGDSQLRKQTAPLMTDCEELVSLSQEASPALPDAFPPDQMWMKSVQSFSSGD